MHSSGRNFSLLPVAEAAPVLAACEVYARTAASAPAAAVFDARRRFILDAAGEGAPVPPRLWEAYAAFADSTVRERQMHGLDRKLHWFLCVRALGLEEAYAPALARESFEARPWLGCMEVYMAWQSGAAAGVLASLAAAGLLRGSAGRRGADGGAPAAGQRAGGRAVARLASVRRHVPARRGWPRARGGGGTAPRAAGAGRCAELRGRVRAAQGGRRRQCGDRVAAPRRRRSRGGSDEQRGDGAAPGCWRGSAGRSEAPPCPRRRRAVDGPGRLHAARRRTPRHLGPMLRRRRAGHAFQRRRLAPRDAAQDAGRRTPRGGGALVGAARRLGAAGRRHQR